MNSLFERLLSTPEVMEALDDRRVFAAMLRFEAALARAQAEVGLIPQAAAVSIAGTCKVELFDVHKLVREAGSARCATEPLVKTLRETVSLFNVDAAAWVHHACSQQALADTAMLLVTRDALALMETDLSRTIAAVLTLADTHAADPMLARSGQPASSVTTFGLTCAQWAAPLARAQQRLRQAADNALCLQLGSSVPSQAAMHGQASLVQTLMAAELKLTAPTTLATAPNPQDERVALACALALLVSSLARVAQDITRLAQCEIAELTPPDSACQVVLAAAQRVPQRLAVLLGSLAQTLDDTPGAWQAANAEWVALLLTTHGALRAMAQTLAGMQVHPATMRARLEARRATMPTREAQALLGADLVQQTAALTRQHLQSLSTMDQAAH